MSNHKEHIELCAYLVDSRTGKALPHEFVGHWCENCGEYQETLPNGDDSGGDKALLSSVSPPTNKKGEQNE